MSDENFCENVDFAQKKRIEIGFVNFAKNRFAKICKKINKIPISLKPMILY